MRRVFGITAVIAGLLVSGCQSSEPLVRYPQSGRSSGSYYGRNDPLQETARDANSVESVVSSVSRIGRLLSGSLY